MPDSRHGATASNEIRAARAYLLTVAEPPSPALWAFVETHGPVAAAHGIRGGTVPDRVVAEIRSRPSRSHLTHDPTGSSGTRLVVPEDSEWPHQQLSALATKATADGAPTRPPLALWVKGEANLSAPLSSAITITGCRASTAYGDHIAADWSYALAGANVATVSGCAYGVDASVHRGSLAGDGPTIAVLPNGLDAGYPAGHDALLDRIAQNGLVITEYPPDTAPSQRRFAARRRLLAALGQATVIVEANVRGEVMRTGHAAAALDRPVMAVPGPITSAASAGCHALLQQGRATVATSASDVLDVLRAIDTSRH